MAEVRVERGERWDWLRLELGRANAVSPAFLTGLDREIDKLPHVDADGPARPLLITGQGSAFSAGLDLRTLTTFDRPRLAAFVREFHGVFLRLACLQRPTIAVVNGHAVAGGAVLVVACDSRIGVESIAGSGDAPRIGFNEVMLGLPFPLAAAAIIEHALGSGAAELMLTGRLLEPAEALQRGLLHTVVAPGDLRHAAEQAAEQYSASSAGAFAAVKASLHRRLVDLAAEHVDDGSFLDAWFSPGAQTRLQQVVARLTSR